MEGVPAGVHIMGETGDVGGLLVDNKHVVNRGTDVFSVIYSPPRVWMNRPMARNSASVLSVRGWPRITAWPPPYLTSAT